MDNSQNNYIQQITDEMICPRCGQNQNTFLALQCQHTFCIVCITYIYLKFKQDLSPHQIKCINCGEISSISNCEEQLIDQTIKKQLLPYVQNKEHQTQYTEIKNKNSHNNQINQNKTHHNCSNNQQSTINKKILMRSQEHSFHINQPPQEFYSRCVSPTTSQPIHNKQYCKLHHHEQLCYVCFTCDNKLLCMHCVNSKAHQGHQFQHLKKSVEYLNDQIGLSVLNMQEQIDILELGQKRLTDRKGIIVEKSQRINKQIRNCFVQLFEKMENKEQQLIMKCTQHCNSLISTIELHIQKIKHNLQTLQHNQSNLQQLDMNHTLPYQFVKKYNLCRKDINSSMVTLEPYVLEQLKYPTNTVQVQLRYLLQQLDLIHMEDNHSNNNSKQQLFMNNINLISNNNMTLMGGTMPVVRNNQQQFIRKESAKRVRTNLCSPTSSHQKKNKKHTVTEEDEKKNHKTKYKSQNCFKITSTAEHHQMPAYIHKFFEKPHIKPFTGVSSTLDNNSNTHQNLSKFNNSKILSKSSIPPSHQLSKRKKKDHTAMVKQRLQRKTVNPIKNIKNVKAIIPGETAKKKKKALN